MTVREIILISITVGSLTFSGLNFYQQNQEIHKQHMTIKSQEQELTQKNDQIFSLENNINQLEDEVVSIEREVERQRTELTNRGTQRRYVDIEVTHYSLSGGSGTGLTANGTVPVAGRTVACNFLPLGTKVAINGQTYIVEDRGGMEGNIVDVFVDSDYEAIQKGRYKTRMEIDI